jgi:MiaB/RimO family radical SAM methylthiotransferase
MEEKAMSTKTQIIIRSCDRRVLELEQVKAWLVGNGFELSDNHLDVDRKADIIILTTCGVTQLHEDYAFETLDRIKAEKKPGAMVILGGCVPEINPKRVSEEFGGPTFSPKSYYKLDEILNLPLKLDAFDRPHTYDMRALYMTDVGSIFRLARSFRGNLLNFKSFSRRLILAVKSIIRYRSTYLIQIHEGCSMGCTYCAIQKAIGPLRNSKPIEAVVEELNEGLDKGYKHIRIIGDSAGSYGLDIGTNLGALLKRISQINRHFSLELTDISPVFLKVIFDPVKELCAQKRISSLYIPIQSGNDRVLGLMHRRLDLNKTRQMLNDIRATGSPGFKLGTSVIVGFPSETTEEFRDTIKICNEVNFDWIWCHGFSSRPGTSATALPGQLSQEEILERVSLFKSSINKKGAVILDTQ